MRKKFRQNMAESGLTLIEVIVAIGIFGLVVSIGFGVFSIAIMSQRRIIALKNVEDNIRFTVESMSREIRTGRDFVKTPDGSLSFTNTKGEGEAVIYRLSSGIVEKSSDGGTNYLAVTGSDTVVNYLNFYLAGQDPNDKSQPRITVTIGATSQVGNQSSNLKIQTTVSARLLQS